MSESADPMLAACQRACERARKRGEGVIEATALPPIPAIRYREWMRGTRPLPGCPADWFFQTLVEAGVLSREEAFVLYKRHEELTRQEEASDNPDFICSTCKGSPPHGFTCKNCGG